MTISIVVPVYNAEQFLERAIQSVLNQTDNNWELILVDDGSTDASGKLCDKYAQKYLNIHSFHKKNEGQFLTRQFGIQKATGEYIGFLDADDYLDSNYVNEIVYSVNNNNMPDSICFGFIEGNGAIDKERCLSKESHFITDGQIILDDIVNKKISGAMWSKVFKSELIKNLHLDAEIVKNKRYGEDAFHSYSLLMHSKTVLYISSILYTYVRNDEGASCGFSNRDLSYFNTKYVWKMLLSYATNYEKNCLFKLYADNFNESIFYILKYYRSAKDNNRRKEIVNYDWSTYLLDMTDDEINNNPYIRKSYIKVWNAFKHKRHLEIFVRERIKKIGWG